ncbi:putative transporter [Golovinomyces cichoracearum]|uniref:Putative transporter n=1 Tax=Golovinomyces cichoracearum TaxID=62708 RepID=A0A420HVJ2_9PEZI|nr:putative transporter [Golovinomyces cichoracearum]
MLYSSHRNAEEPNQIDIKSEAALRRKIDYYVVPTVAILYLFCFIDRANIGNAKLAGLERDLKMTGFDFNKMLTAFYISYVFFEIPCNVICKWMGPGWFIPLISLGFGVCSLCMAFVQNLQSASVVRFLIGSFEAGMLPGIAYYLSRWYRRRELVFRLSLYIVMAPIAGAFGGLLASGILKINSIGMIHSWRLIFFIEGLMTIIVALISFLTMTDRPETARWLTPEEKSLCHTRMMPELTNQVDILDKIDTKKLFRGIFNPVTLPVSLIFLLVNITVQGFSFFTPTIVATIYPNSSVISQQLHTVPPYLVGAFFTLLIPLLSSKYDKRMYFFITSAPLMIIGYLIFVVTSIHDAKIRYAATFLMASGSFSFGALCNAQVAANVVSDTARSGAMATNGMLGSLGGLASTWSILPSDAPKFLIGNALNLATSATILLISVLLLFWMKWDNRRRNSRNLAEELCKLSELSQKQVEDLEWRHPLFRWKI